MTVEDRLANLMRSDADTYNPGDGRQRIRERAHARRRARIVRRTAMGVVALGVAAAIAVPLLNAGKPRKVTTLNSPPPARPPRTTPTGAPSRSVSDTSVASSLPTPAAALDAYLAAHREAVSHSQPVNEGGSVVAVVGVQRATHVRAIEVLDLASGTARLVAEVVLPEPSYDLSPDLAVQVADVTGDGVPDFLVRVIAADNNPGVVVSDDGGPWRLIPEQTTGVTPAVTDVYLGRDPSFSAHRLESIHNDCNPSCAAGHQSITAWTYDRASRYFRPV